MRKDFLIRTVLQRNGLSQQRTELPIPGIIQEEAICQVVNGISEGGERLGNMTCKIPFYFQNVMTDWSCGQEKHTVNLKKCLSS